MSAAVALPEPVVKVCCNSAWTWAEYLTLPKPPKGDVSLMLDANFEMRRMLWRNCPECGSSHAVWLDDATGRPVDEYGRRL